LKKSSFAFLLSFPKIISERASFPVRDSRQPRCGAFEIEAASDYSAIVRNNQVFSAHVCVILDQPLIARHPFAVWGLNPDNWSMAFATRCRHRSVLL
jgi:hypothetical protein